MENLWVVSEKLKPVTWALVGVVNILALSMQQKVVFWIMILTETSFKISAKSVFQRGKSMKLPMEKNLRGWRIKQGKIRRFCTFKKKYFWKVRELCFNTFKLIQTFHLKD